MPEGPGNWGYLLLVCKYRICLASESARAKLVFYHPLKYDEYCKNWLGCHRKDYLSTCLCQLSYSTSVLQFVVPGKLVVCKKVSEGRWCTVAEERKKDQKFLCTPSPTQGSKQNRRKINVHLLKA